MGYSIIERENIQLKVEAASWQEAVRKAGEILVNNGYATDNYVEAMVQTASKLGPYIVIAPGLALPHARPEDGALKPGISLITLEKPLNFGNVDNDPVYVVIALAGSDNKTHLGILQTIAAGFEDKNTVSRIYNSKTAEDIVEIIENGRREVGSWQNMS